MSQDSWGEIARRAAAWEWGRRHYKRYARFRWLDGAVLVFASIVAAAVILGGWKPWEYLPPNSPPSFWTARIVNADKGVFTYWGVSNTDEDRQPAASLRDGDSIKIVCQTRGRLVPDSSGSKSDVWYRLQDNTYINDMYATVQEGEPATCE